MLYFLQDKPNGTIIGVTEKLSDEQRALPHTYRWDFKTLADAEMVAAEATALNDGNVYIAQDGGESISPRFDVVRAPAKGDPISYAFNGDYYPDGHIKSISKTGKKITSTTGRSYYRTREHSAKWRYAGTWTLVYGHHDKRNPEF